jgi:hypothetical protein
LRATAADRTRVLFVLQARHTSSPRERTWTSVERSSAAIYLGGTATDERYCGRFLIKK